MALDDTGFERLADQTLARLSAAVEERLSDAVDVEQQGGILTLELDDGRQYVINKHGPNRQIWLSSPVSGAWHFAWDEGRKVWLSTREPAVLEELLAGELARATGTDFAF
ncbi:MAG: iron donor protein CyaY [Alphaproteobacteria bacterium]|nr:iron donor protein CyaY [Alphaproteobacteria bacterium]